MMLGRKQSLKGEPVLADYGPDEAFNESADTEWVNKVFLRVFMMIFFLGHINLYFIIYSYLQNKWG